MTEGRQIAVVRSYDELLAVCRQQVGSLGINYAILDEVTKFADGAATKHLAHARQYRHHDNGKLVRGTKRYMSPEAIDSYLVALCFDLIAVENPQKVEKLRDWLKLKSEGRKRPAFITKPRAYRVSMADLKPILKALSAKAAEARRKKIPLWKRRQIARKAARARWRRPRRALASTAVNAKPLSMT